ncbi:DUF4912 domain-containing protein [Capilliphycus salinus ALCB114379]|uniref:DUF4912 domain-containing protein n=1 Tax=Capilliphycus salinus TaxID=2768948 RepID=UPI0039A4A15D
MSRTRKTLFQIPVVLLALASTPGLFTVSLASFLNQAAFAQTSQAEPSESETERTLTLPETFDNDNPTFTVPKSLAEDTSVTVNGSSSMSEINKALQKRFVERFPDAQVELAASGTNEALEALKEGKLDLAAVGRPLTEEEKAAGLVAVPIGREKLAIITGPNNSFNGDLTFEQFARMFRGEITNWSEVGGSDGEIRFIDRPGDSDTRRALSTYDVFETAAFTSGPNTIQASEDQTDAVVAELGDNGIGYAIADQVLNRDDVKIIPMHKTLPDDPRYPYSQYRSYVYNENNKSPKVLAFLAFATTAPGQEILAETETEQPVGGTAPAAVVPAAPQQTAQVPPAVEEQAEEEETAGFPWWILLLLAIPLLGGLIWLLFKGGQGEPVDDSSAAPPTATGTGTTPTPTTPTTPPATATGTATTPTPTTPTTPPVTGTETGVTPTATGATPVAPGTDINFVTPGSPSGTSVASGNVGVTPPGLGIGVVAGGLAAGAAWWAGRTPSSRITFALGDDQNAYAYWVVPDGDKDFAKEHGGQNLQLRVYDVTDIDEPEEQAPHGVQVYDCEESSQEQPVLNLEGNREYIAEMGYVTPDHQWLMLARSNRVQIPLTETPTDEATPNLGLAASGMDAGSVTNLIPVLTAFGSHMTLRVADHHSADADWEVPEGGKTAAKEYGGRYPQLRIYDVTDIDDLDAEAPHDIRVYDWDESTQTQQFADLDSDRIYLAEIGYATEDDRWLRLARSNRVRIPVAQTITDGAIPGGLVVPGLIGLGGAALIPMLTAFGSHITLRLTDNRTLEADWEVPENAKNAAKEYGGRYPQLRICDVTDLDDLDRQSPHDIRVYDWDEWTQTQQFAELESDRVYLAEIGYASEDDGWLRLARSNRVRIPVAPTSLEEIIPNAGLVVTGLDTGTVSDVIGRLTAFGSHMTLRLTDNRTLEADWEVPENAKTGAIEYGGRYPQLRICDVTDIDDLDRVAPHDIRVYDWDESTQTQQFAELESDRVYLAEIGYASEDDGWLRLARSNRVRIPVAPTSLEEIIPNAGLVVTGLDTGTVTDVMGRLTAFGSHITLRLTDNRTLEADWEVPENAKTGAIEYGGRYPQLRICDVTDIDDLDREVPHNIQVYDWDEWSQSQQFAELESDRLYLIEIGYATEDDQWLRLARSNRVRLPVTQTTTEEVRPDTDAISELMSVGGAAALIPFLTAFGSHITLWLSDSQTADSEWEVPENAKNAAIEYGGRYPQLRLCDVTDLDDLDRQPPHSIQVYEWDESSQSQQFPNLESQHIYLVEIGYGTEDNQWLRLARSNRVVTPAVETSNGETATPSLGSVVPTGVVTGAAAGLIPLLTELGSQITFNLDPEDEQTANVAWEVPDTALRAAQERGGRQMQLRIYDVTDVVDLDRQSPNRVRRYDCEASTTERRVPLLDRNCEYLAEIGYLTDDGQWLMLARSNRVRVPEVQPDVSVADTSSSEAVNVPLSSRFPSSMTLIPTGSGTADVRWDIGEDAKQAAKRQGGRKLQLRVYDVTDINDSEPGTTVVETCECDESVFEWELEQIGERDYLTEIGYVTDDGEWLMLARSNRVRVADASSTEQGVGGNLGLTGAGLIGAGVLKGSTLIRRRGEARTSSVTIIPSDNQAANVYWEVPDAVAEDVQQRGGRQFQLHLYDVTDIPPDSLATNSVQQYNFEPVISEPVVLELEGNHDYIAEIGYLTADGEWLMLARSYRVRIPASTSVAPVEPTPTRPEIALPQPEVVPTLDSNRCRVSLIPCDNEAVNVYWEVPDAAAEDIQQRGGRQFQLHLYDVTDIRPDSVATNSVQQYDFDVSLPHPELLHLEGNHDYIAEIGYLTEGGQWLVLARSYRVRVPASTSSGLPDVGLIAAGATPSDLASIPCRIVLTPGVEGAIDAEWDVPNAAKQLAKQRGGYQFQLRAYDVTNSPVDISASSLVEQCSIAESISSWQFELAFQREYVVEVGYLTEEGLWLLLARSNRLYVPVEEVSDEEAGSTAVAFIAGANSFESYITLSLGDHELVDARWEVPNGAKEWAKQQGGQKFQLHVYEVTGIDVETQSPRTVQRYNCNELIKQWQVPNLNVDCEYMVEIGYATDAGEWLMLARSNCLRVPATSGAVSDVTGVSPQVAISARITLTLSDNSSADAHWELPRAAVKASIAQGGQKFQLRIYDVTGIDLQTQSAENVRRYNCHELIQQLQIPNLEANREYFAEIGYVTSDEQWLMLARSNSVRVSGSDLINQTTLGTTVPSISTVSQVVSQGMIPAVATTPQAVTPGNCAIEHLTVHSRRNCHLLDEERMRRLQETAVSQTLEPGLYVIRIKSGGFGYGSEVSPVGEPMVIFWIYGGTVINKKTRVPVAATWSTLNGFHDSLTLEVRETATLCAFFFDTYPEDNQGEVTVSVARLYDFD